MAPVTPAMQTRGLHSPRVPGGGPHYLPQPAAVCRPTGVLTTSFPSHLHPMVASPTSTPLVVSRPLSKDVQPAQIVLERAPEPDEMSRTWNRSRMPGAVTGLDPM